MSHAAIPDVQKILATVHNLLAFVLAVSLAGVPTTTSAAEKCRDLFVSTPMQIKKVETPQNILSELYAESKTLSFGNADHESPKAFLELEKFLKVHGHDRELKSIAIEASSELAPFFESASTRDLTADDWSAIGPWEWYLETQAETVHIMTVLVPLIRKLNLERARDPLLLVPIDGIEASTMMSGVKQEGDKVDLEVPISPKSLIDWMFIQSIDGELKTAENYAKLISHRWPNRKGIVIYHQAHVLRNLQAWGVTRSHAKVRAIKAPLSWVDYVSKSDPIFAANYRVVFFDTASKSNPSGVIRDLPTSPTAYAFRTTDNPTFNSDSFLATYRTRSIRISDSRKQIADGVIRLP